MEAKKTVVEKYNRELEEIEELIELVKAGESSDGGLINMVKNVIASAYYDGMLEGTNDMVKFTKSNFFLKIGEDRQKRE